MTTLSLVTPKRLAVFSVVALSLSLGACAETARDQRMLDGALIGGAGGAIVGGVASGTAGGAVVGGVAGAAAGAVIADATRPRYHTRSCWWSESRQRRVCSYR